MADYYPLIAKAVTGLEKSTGEARRALYDRARQALLAQLRGVTPALSEADITRERLALEEAVRKVEAEAARRSRSDPPPPRYESRPAPPPPEPEERVEAQQEPPAPRAPLRPTPRPSAPPTELPEPPPAAARQGTPSALSAAAAKTSPEKTSPEKTSPERTSSEPRQSDDRRDDARAPPPGGEAGRVERTRWTPGGGPSLSSSGLKGFRDVVSETETLGDATAQAAKNVRATFPGVPDAELERAERGGGRVEPRAPTRDDVRGDPRGDQRGDLRVDARAERRSDLRAEPRPDARLDIRAEPQYEPEPSRPSSRRPSPRDGEKMLGREPDGEPPRREQRDGRRSRDAEPPRPSSRRSPPPLPDDEPDDLPPDEPADDDYDPSARAEYPTRAPGSMVRQEDVRARMPAPRAAKSERKAVPVKRQPRPWRKYVSLVLMAVLVLVVAGVAVWKGPGIIKSFRSTPNFNRASDIPAPGDGGAKPKINDRVGSGPFTPQGSVEGAMVAQKVVLYEEDQNDPAGKRFTGQAVWRTEMASPAPGQPAEMVVRADIDIPDQKIGLKWSLRRNTDKQLPASHMVEVMFNLPPDFAHGGISSIPGILMKQAETTRGIPLAGQAVKVTSSYFLIGLSSVDSDMQRNMQLLKDRPWFDIPVVYNDGRRAIIAIEKGTPGDRAFTDAFAAWGQ
jgi:hypothetical protein